MRVDFNFTEVVAQLELLLRAEILVAEEDDATFGNEESEFIFLLVGEVCKLKTNDLSSDVGC